MNKIIIGDCREVMRTLIDDGVRVQTCVTSPPYWGLRDYNVDGQFGLEPTTEEYVENMVEVFRLVRDLLADDGTLWLNLGDTYNTRMSGSANGIGKRDACYRESRAAVAMKHTRNTTLKNKDLCMIPARVALALQEDGWWLRQIIIWAKPNPMPESARDRCTKSHENIFLLAKRERYYFDQEAIAEPVAESTKARMAQPNIGSQRGSERVPGKTNGTMKAVSNGETRNKRDVWFVPTKKFKESHFATFPPALIEPCILAGSRVGDIVFDPFMGSGTTAQVAQDLGRQHLGAELNPDYEDMQRDRTAQQGLGI